MSNYEKRKILYGRDNTIQRVCDFIPTCKNGKNSAFFGIKGIGKSSIIRTVFTDDSIKDYYSENKVIIVIVDRTAPKDNVNDFCCMLYNKTMDALRSLDKKNAKNIRNDIIKRRKELEEEMGSYNTSFWEDMLKVAASCAKRNDYRIFLVIDDFERLAAADDYNLKANQYTYLRSMAGDNDLLSIMLFTCQDLSSISIGIDSSGFSGIFSGKSIERLEEEDVEDWIYSIIPEDEITPEIIDWIIEMSACIPGVAEKYINAVFNQLSSHEALNKNICNNQVNDKLQESFEYWWKYINEDEKIALIQIALKNEESADINAQENLIDKGLLDDSGEEFTVPLFREFVKKKAEKAGRNTAGEILGGIQDLKGTVNFRADHTDSLVRSETDRGSHAVTDSFKETYQRTEDVYTAAMNAWDKADKTYDLMNERTATIIDSLEKQIEVLRSMIRPKTDFVMADNPDMIDEDRYISHIQGLITPNVEDEVVCKTWGITKDDWEVLSKSKATKNFIVTAYYTSLLFTGDPKDVPNNVDYSPVTIMLGKFAEEAANSFMLPIFKDKFPNLRIGNRYTVNDFPYKKRNKNIGMTLGEVSQVIRDKHDTLQYLYTNKERESKLSSIYDDFQKQMDRCTDVRNDSAHTSYVNRNDMDKITNNLFHNGNNGMGLAHTLVKLFKENCG